MKHRHFKDVTTLSYSDEKCVGCGMCEKVCPHGVFYMSGGKAFITDRDSCIECGACVQNCPAGAIEVDAGAGCAVAILFSWVTGKEPTCGCGGGDCCS